MYMHLFACRFSEFLMRKPPSQSARSQRSLQMYTGNCATGGLVNSPFGYAKGCKHCVHLKSATAIHIDLEGRQRPTSRHDVAARAHAAPPLATFRSFCWSAFSLRAAALHGRARERLYKPQWVRTNAGKILIGVASFFLTILQAPSWAASSESLDPITNVVVYDLSPTACSVG